MERVRPGDAEVVARQIGRVPRGDYAIAVRCSYGFPQVLRVPPVVDGAPFPTLYWLSCPFLCRAVGDLEAGGWVGRLEERVAAEAALRAALEQAHGEYIAERHRLLAVENLSEACRQEGTRLLEDRGIGGIADRRRLKCLHLHVAHALVSRNPIGAIVLRMLPNIVCDREEKICSSLGGGRSRSEINR